MLKAALWIRVSDPGQHADNQLPDLKAWADRRGLEIVLIYQLTESAWQGGHQKKLSQVYEDARGVNFLCFCAGLWIDFPGKVPWLLWKSCTGWVKQECRSGPSRNPGRRLVGNSWTCC